MTIPYIALPLDEESFASTILRTAQRNGYLCVDQFLKSFGLGNSGIPANQWVGSNLYRFILGQPVLRNEDRELLKSIFNTKSMRYRTDVFAINGIQLPAHMLRQDLAICPDCLREGYLHHMHAYEFCDICPKHSQYYYLMCPSCNTPISWRNLKGWICACGQDLCQLSTQSADNYSTMLLAQAIREADHIYMENLCTAIKCTRYLESPIRSHALLADCQNIATGDKDYLFSHIRKQQSLYPCLHRRAILAPWLLTDNTQLRTYAIEYFFAASQQQKPSSRAHACGCSQLLFSPAELRFTFKIERFQKSKIPNQRRPTGTTINLFQVQDLCRLLMENPKISWDDFDHQPYPCNANRLMNATEAAYALTTSKQTIKRLHYFGLLKGERFQRKVGILFPYSEVERFQQTYLLNREISKNLGIKPKTVQKLLTSAGIQEVRNRAFGSSLVAYRKDDISAELLSFLTTPRPPTAPRLQSATYSGVLFGEAASKLRLDAKDIPTLIKMGILETAPAIRSTGLPGRDLCTRKSLYQALRWRSRLLTFLEVEKLSGCSTIMIHTRFASANFIKEIKLKTTSLMSYLDAEKVRNHFKVYTTEKTARTEYRLNPKSIQQQIAKNRIHPLLPTHKDFLKGQNTIMRAELDAIYRASSEY